MTEEDSPTLTNPATMANGAQLDSESNEKTKSNLENNNATKPETKTETELETENTPSGTSKSEELVADSKSASNTKDEPEVVPQPKTESEPDNNVNSEEHESLKEIDADTPQVADNSNEEHREPVKLNVENTANNDSNGADETNDVETLHTVDQHSTYSASNFASPAKRFSISHLTDSASISFLKSNFESLIAIKDIMKKHQDIVQKCSTVLEILKTGVMPPEDIIFEPLKLACEQSNIEAKILALDCLSKIFTFNLFTKPIYWDYSTQGKVKASKAKVNTDEDLDVSTVQSGKVLLIEAAINVVVSCFEGEGTDERVELQIIKVLTGAVVNESMPVHGKVLLQAIRQIHNIFLLSLSPVNQSIAQATIIQIVNSVYDKVLQLQTRKKLANSLKSSNNLPGETRTSSNGGENLTLQQLQDTSNDIVQLTSDEVIGDEDELYIKDAFLVFRSMSNLASKVIDTDSLDMRSHKIRVKLLSLHIIRSILKNYMDVFVNKEYLIFNKNSDETTILVDGIRKYLCLAISRNATSQLSPVYQITLEIYWLLVKNLRSEFKYEIPIFMDEIYFNVGEMKTSSSYQKRYVLELIRRLSCDPKILIEFFLNYDCDTTLPNLCEKIVDYLTRYALLRVDTTLQQKLNFKNFQKSHELKEVDSIPELNSSKLSSTAPNPDYNINFPADFALKMVAIDSIVSFLQSLNTSSGNPLQFEGLKQSSELITNLEDLKSIASEARLRGSSIVSIAHSASSHSDMNNLRNINTNNSSANMNEDSLNTASSPVTLESSNNFDTVKQRKTYLLEGIRLFNFSPKKGIAYLSKNGFLDANDPKTIAKFILENDTLDKTQVGEYLGGSKEQNIAVMHEFLDQMDFVNKSFLDALRSLLQHFRLPGESQVIDRFMLKFAEKYVNDNPKEFANADTVYVLSYSVIMLNTDQHSPQVKNRMTLDDFIKNNRGIDDGKDLDPKFLEEVYKDIQGNEIILNSEQQAALLSDDTPLTQQTFLGTALFGRDYATKEAYTKASKVLSKKTENTVISLGKDANKKNAKYYNSDPSTNPEHVKSMFDNLWMSLLAGLTPPFKDYDDEEITNILLYGIHLSTHLACIFDIDFARTSFIKALVQFSNINNPEDMKDKNIQAIYTLLAIAVDENSYLKTSWKDVFVVISQVERLRLLSKGVASNSIPDLLNARLAKKSIDTDSNSITPSGLFSFGSSSASKRASISQQASEHHFNQKLPTDMINKINATELDVSMDKVFSKSSEIQGDGIFDFVNGLAEVAREEIVSSGNSREPRIFCLQKMVDFCYYNMSRIRVQWSELWKVLNQEFNEFGCNPNKYVAFFAIDSLRQLSERFFNIDELAHFKFQKEFLKPFDFILVNNENLEVRGMVLDCIQYLIVKKGKSKQIKSGWSTILEILTHVAYSEDSEHFVSTGLQYAIKIMDYHLDDIEEQDSFPILVDCLCEYAKNEKYQKISLKALSMINRLVEQNGEEVDLRVGDDTYLNKRWFPLLFSFNNIIMEGNDLEVRAKALNFMFEALIIHGKKFDKVFWDKICNELLFPIFDILKRHGQINFNKDESLWVWLSSTLIQALRKMILLFTTFFKELNGSMDGFLSLLISCICQDNDAISKIGISCLEDLILQNMEKFEDEHWDKVEVTFKELFKLTSANELFELDPLKKKNNNLGIETGGSENTGNDDDDDDYEEEDDDNEEAYSEINPDNKYSSQEIVIKCVLHLHMIQILSELFDNNDFYKVIPYKYLIKLTHLLSDSYQFAKDFNEDYNLRVRLWNAGIVDKLPNLLKQETSSVGVYISVLFRLYCDEEKVDDESRGKIVKILIPLAKSLIKKYNEFEEKDELRNLQNWTPVVVEIVQAMTELNDTDFISACPEIYSFVVGLFGKNMSVELREVMKEFMIRVGDIYIVKKDSNGEAKTV